MIYLFNDVKELTGTVRNNHILNLLYEREKNGIYSVSAEIPVTYNDQGTIYNYNKKIQKSDFLGHYDREGRFQLHKIAAVDIENGSIFVKGIHIFFDEAKAGAIIQDRRFINREIIDGARVAFESIGWSVADFDVSVGKTYNFYNVTPLEARQILVETFGFEFDYWLDFDGKKVTNRHVAVKEKIGEKSSKRYTYGHNVLNIRAEQDYSEIYTAVIGRGKGEEIEETGGYGRRIEYTDVVWSKPSKPLNKPAGTRVLEDPNATQLFGYKENGVVKPRVKVEVFSDIESPTELIQASYEWLMDNNVPKAVFSLKVADGDGLNLGDEVYVIYRDIDLVKSARVEKVIDDLVSGNRDVEFGDTAYFDTDRRLSGLRSDLKRYSGETGDRIYRLKMEFNRRFDEEVSSWVTEFEQNLIDVHAEIEADRENMSNLIEGTRTEFTDNLNAEISQTKEYAEQQAQEKADSVQTNLESFSERHQQLYDEVTGNIIDIDTFLGDKSETLRQQFDKVHTDLSGIESELTTTKSDLQKQLGEARTELENKIDTTEEALNKVGEDLGSAKTDLQNQLDEARAELEGLEVGGRNLIKDSNTFTGRWQNFQGSVVSSEEESNGYTRVIVESGSSHIAVMRMINELKNEYSGEELTLSFDLINHGEDFILLHNWSGGSDSDYIPTGYNQRYKNTGVLSASAAGQIQFRTHTNPPENGLDFSIRNLQVEIGNVATDWTPAPEDTEQKITNINQTITNIEGELSSKVEQTEVDALKGTVTAQGTLLTQTANEVSSKAEKSVVDTLTGRVANAESSVTQNAEEIAKKLTKSVYDEDKKATDAKITQWSNTATETAEGLERVIGRVSQTETGVETAQTRIEAEAGRIDGVLSRTSKVEGQVQDAQLAIEANADGLALRATKTEVEQAIDGIEVGGRNLILDSSNIQNRSRAAGITSEKVTDMGYTNVLKINNPELRSYFTIYRDSYAEYPTANKDFTLSFLVRGIADENSDKTLTTYYNASTGYTPMEGDIKEDEYSWVSVTFNTHDNVPNNHIGVSSFKELYFAKMKVEMGNIRTDWTPAPEDIDASISEVTDRVTTAEAELVVQAGEISQKASQSELDRVTGRVSTAETSIIQNADEIARRLVKSDYDSDKQETDAEITKWSNLTTETAEGLEQTIRRVSTSESGISQAQADIQTNADGIAGVIRDVEAIDGNLSSLTTEFNVEAGKIQTLISKTNGHEANISDLQLTADSFGVTIGEVENGLIDRINGIQTWHYNLIRGSQMTNFEFYNTSGGITMQDEEINYFRSNPGVRQPQVRFIEPVSLEAGEIYTISFDFRSTAIPEADYFWFIANDGTSNVNVLNYVLEGNIYNIPTNGEWHRRYVRFEAPRNITGHFRIGSDTGVGDTTNGTFDIRLPYLTVTDNTDWLYHPLDDLQNMEELSVRVSNFEQTIDQISATVRDIDQDVVKQSQVYVGASGVQIGSTYVGDAQLASILEVSPRSIDVITENMNLTGNLNVKGQIESLAVSAVRGDIAYLKSNILTANSITSEHLSVSTAMVHKLFAASARIDELITKSHFVNKMHALTLDVVDLNASQIRTKLLSANTIEASWIKSGTALVDRVFSSTAMFERMMAKSGFVTTLNTVTIDTDQLTIRRPDGVAWVSQGLARGHVPVQIFDNFADSSVQFSGLNFVTSSSFWKNFKYFYTPHEGSRLRVVWAVSLQTGNSASEYIEVGVNGFGNYNPISNGAGSSTRRQLVYAGQTEYITQDIPLPPPNFQTFQANLQFRRSPTGVHMDNRVTARILHIGQYN